MSNNNLGEIDHLSGLPEHLILQILSFLPTKSAVRTSLLARRFHDLWTFSPSIELDRNDFPPGLLFNNVTSLCLFLRNPSSPLLGFCLKASLRYKPFPIIVISDWLNCAYSLGLRDLSLHIHSCTIESLFPLILSFGSLDSLVISTVDLDWNFRFQLLVPSNFPLTQLKYLHIKANISTSDMKTFVMEQRNLEYLCIETPPQKYSVDLYSQSVKILKLNFELTTSDKISLSLPKLQHLELVIGNFMELITFHGEMPALRKAIVETISHAETCVPGLYDILKTIRNVSELTLHIGTPYQKPIPAATHPWKLNDFDLFHPLVEPGKDMPMFPNLRNLKLLMCFYEKALEDLICLLHHSPVIDSLHLIDVEGPSKYQRHSWVPEHWHFELPLNSEGNRNFAHFSNLQTGDKKSEVIKLLSGERSTKRLKT
ncbi:F-box/LRR-repeat protein At3g26922-like [Carex rostrata]